MSVVIFFVKLVEGKGQPQERGNPELEVDYGATGGVMMRMKKPLFANTCFRCALCGNVTAFCSLSLNKTIKTPLQKRQVCTKFINVIMENNWLHKSGANSTLYNVAMTSFPILSQNFIWTYPGCFAVTKFPSATSMYLSVSNNEPGIHS